MPQDPRSKIEERFFHRSLETVSALIRNCAFTYFYPPLEPRLWILHELAEFTYTSDGELLATSDLALLQQHVEEMVQTSVQAVLEKYNYRWSYESDRKYLTAWLELLVLLKMLPFDVGTIRLIMEGVTWFVAANTHSYRGALIELRKSEGVLVFHGKVYHFTPFPQYDEFVRRK
ncbi:hypothetical protein IFR04_010509 [Cadophora malorum]|uniref:Uncharacterized protein n=1 Tax=Cadophora malorum TaxID=108018 RepID=A0A8H7TB14_9HELO|nr:hypothetical protein IFR04_010509 [Cadophora malorum]